MCSELGVSRQGYYAWRARLGQSPSPRATRRAELAKAVEAVFRRHRGRYGAPRVWVELRRQGWTVGMNTVASVMASLGLAGKSRRRGARVGTLRRRRSGCSRRLTEAPMLLIT